MKTLTLVRHAKSSWDHSLRSDFERPLNKRGQRDAPAMGRHLCASGLMPEAVLTSPALRAATTARELALALGLDLSSQLIEEPRIYAASAAELVDIVRGIAPAWTHVFLVGHNPGMIELLQWLCRSEPATFVTCAVAVVDLDVVTWRRTAPGCGVLREFHSPKKMAGMKTGRF